MRTARGYQQEADRLRAQGRAYREIVADWRQRYGVSSRVAYRLAHGLTQAQVAQRWNEQWPDAQSPKTGKHISYWEIWPGAAGRAPSYETLNRLAFLYSCSAGDLLDGEDHSHRDLAAVRRRSRMPPSPEADLVGAAPRTPVTPAHKITTITSGVVEDFESLTDTYRHVDYKDGARHVTADVALHLRRLMDLSTRPTPVAVQRRLLRAGADAAQLSAWLAIDGQRYEQAVHYCKVALSLAEEANDRTLQAYSLGVMSYIHLHAGDGHKALRLLDAARAHAGRGAPSSVASWLAEAAGEAHGLLGDPISGLRALTDAERHFDRIAPEDTPVWLGFYDADCHCARLKGRCLLRIGHPKRAVPVLYEALALLPSTFVRERSGTLIDLASAYARLGHVEQACDAATLADQLARRTGSDRNRKRLRELLLELLPWAGQDCVRNLYHQVLLD